MTDTGARDEALLRQQLQIGFQAQVAKGSLSIDVAVANGTTQSLFVFDGLWAYAYNGAIVAPPSPAYVSVVDHELRLALRRLPVPAGRMVPIAVDPFVTEVKAGDVWRRQLAFAVPVREYSCYFDPLKPEDADALQADRIRCIVGVVVGALPGAFVPSAFRPGMLRIANASKFGAQLLLESAPVASQVQVLRARGAFERF